MASEESAPDDSVLPAETWTRLKAGWAAYNQEVDRLSVSMEAPSTATATGQAVALTTTNTEQVLRSWIGPSEMTAYEDLQAILHRPDLVKDALQVVRDLGLDVVHPGKRSAISMIEEVQAALACPPGEAPSPSAVLIPAREAIQTILATLLPRRPQQEPARTDRLKVESIGRQCGATQLAQDHFERLGAELERLIDELSGGKQSTSTTSALGTLFDQALQFLIAFLSSLNDKRMR